MALTQFQQTICHLIADNRLSQGESYVAGGAALNLLAKANRISRDIDLFHDTTEALQATWKADRKLLENHGYTLNMIHERPAYVEASVVKGEDAVLMQWMRDSAFRFFPLVQHDEFGLVLHPLDLATNKTLALVGRLEIRDWIDMVTCHERIQPLGFLVWAACAKDPGFSPLSILEQAGQSGHYAQVELSELSFDGPPPDLSELSRKWHAMCEEARRIVEILPPEHAGTCVLNHHGDLYCGSAQKLSREIAAQSLLFHAGSIRGAYPSIIG